MTRRRALERVVLVAGGAAALACNVEPTAHDECHAKLDADPSCPAAALVVMSDFVSTQVALARTDGHTLCGSLMSSARADTSSVGFALSGDVVLPSSRPPSRRAVLIDRYGTNVLSFLDPETGAVTGQLPLGTGFESNPQDYLEIDDRLALVPRWGENPLPGQQPFDGGGDVLVIDTRALGIAGSIALPRDGDYPPRPAGITRVQDEAIVTLQRASTDIRSMGDGMLVGIELGSLETTWTLTLTGYKNCGTFAVAPDALTGAVACTGFIDRSGAGANLDQSGIVVLDLSVSPPVELRRLDAADLAGGPLQDDLEYFAPDHVLAKTQTALDGGANNRLLAVDLTADPASAAETLLEARPGDAGAGRGVVLGGMLCMPGCNDECLVADADRGVLERFAIAGTTLAPLSPIALTGTVGLPPRDVGGI